MADAGQGPWERGRRWCAAGAAVAVAAAVVSGAPAVWAWSLDRPVGRGWPLACVLCLAAGSVLVLVLVLRRRSPGGRYAAVLVSLVLFLVVAQATVFMAAQAGDSVRVRLRGPRGVAAVVEHCRVTGRQAGDDGATGAPTYGCTYRWSAGGRQVREEREQSQARPDGWPTRVWPAGARVDTGRPGLLAVPFWGGLAVLGLIASVRLAVVLVQDARAAGLWP